MELAEDLRDPGLGQVEDLADLAERGDLVVVGGDAAGMSAASKAKRERPDLEVVVFERGTWVSYAHCGMPYYVKGAVADLEEHPVEEPGVVLEVPDDHHLDVAEVVDVVAGLLEEVEDKRPLGRHQPFADRQIDVFGDGPCQPRLPGFGPAERRPRCGGADRGDELVQARRNAEGNDAWVFGGIDLGHDNKFSTVFTKRFTRYRKQENVYTESCDFHSFRKDFNSMLARAGVEWSSRKRLMGHVIRDLTEGTYDPCGEPMAVRQEYINRIDLGFAIAWNDGYPVLRQKVAS